MTTYHSISLEILQDLIEPILSEILVETLLNEKVLRETYGSLQHPKLINGDRELSNRMEVVDNKLIFQSSQITSISTDSVVGTPAANSTSNGNTNNGEYFQCLNCDRKIAGTRFAAHIDKCLGGRSRK